MHTGESSRHKQDKRVRANCKKKANSTQNNINDRININKNTYTKPTPNKTSLILKVM